MKKLRLFFLLLCPTCWTFAQGVQTPLMTTVLPGLNASWPGECGPSALDNQSLASRQNIYHSVAAQGAGSWTVTLQYSNTSCTGPWTTYSSINQGSSPAITVGLDSPFTPAKFIKVAITGAAIATYTGERGLFLNPGSGSSVTFPITIAQGGTNATSVIGALANLDIPPVPSAAYNWTPQTPAASLTAGGVNQHIPLTSSPPGVAGANTAYWVYITDATSGSEPVLVTGGTCTSGGGACYLTGTPTYNHTSGQWTVGPGNAGASEAAVANPAGTLVQAPCTALTWHTPMLAPTNAAANAATKFIGCGRESTLITIAADYPVAQPVFQSSGYLAGSVVQPGPDFEDFQVFFPQPDSTTLASYYHWTAFGMSNTPRFEIHNVTLNTPWIGVLALGNSGGAVIDGLWDSAMNTGINFDGAQDTVRILNWHHWPFGTTTNQATAFYTTAVSAGQFGEVDDLDISNSLNFSGTAYHFYAGLISGLPPNAKLSQISFDTWGGLKIDAGQVLVSNSYFTVGATSNTEVTQTGGQFSCDNCWFLSSSNANPVISVNTANGTAGIVTTQISNSHFGDASTTTGRVSRISVTNSSNNAAQAFQLVGNHFYVTGQFVAFTNPLITVFNGTGSVRATITSNQGLDQTKNSPWLSLAQDQGHVVFGNAFPGWSSVLPASITSSLIEDGNVVYSPLKIPPTPEAPVILTNTAGQNDDIAVSGLRYVWLQGATGPFSVSGFAGGVDGQIIMVENPSSYPWTLLAGTGSAGGNQISIPANLTIACCQSLATFAYDASNGYWTLIATTPTILTSAAVVGTNSGGQQIAATLASGDVWLGNGSNVPTATTANSSLVGLSAVANHAQVQLTPGAQQTGTESISGAGTFGNTVVPNNLNGTLGTAALISSTAGGDLSGTLPSPTVAAVNGAAVPTSAAVAGTNGSNQIIAATLASTDVWVGNGSNVPTATATIGTGSVVRATSPTLVAPVLGAATATSVLASGLVDGQEPTQVTTVSSCTLGTASGCSTVAYNSGVAINEYATAGNAITYTLPVAAAGKWYCVGNGYNGSAANTGALTIQTSAVGQYIVWTDGTLSASGGYALSTGAAGDYACVRGLDATHWYFRPEQGSWAKH